MNRFPAASDTFLVSGTKLSCLTPSGIGADHNEVEKNGTSSLTRYANGCLPLGRLR